MLASFLQEKALAEQLYLVGQYQEVAFAKDHHRQAVRRDLQVWENVWRRISLNR